MDATLVAPATQAPAMCTKGQCNSDSFWQCWIMSELREGKELNSRMQL